MASKIQAKMCRVCKIQEATSKTEFFFCDDCMKDWAKSPEYVEYYESPVGDLLATQTSFFNDDPDILYHHFAIKYVKRLEAMRGKQP